MTPIKGLNIRGDAALEELLANMRYMSAKLGIHTSIIITVEGGVLVNARNGQPVDAEDAEQSTSATTRKMEPPWRML